MDKYERMVASLDENRIFQYQLRKDYEDFSKRDLFKILCTMENTVLDMSHSALYRGCYENWKERLQDNLREEFDLYIGEDEDGTNT